MLERRKRTKEIWREKKIRYFLFHLSRSWTIKPAPAKIFRLRNTEPHWIVTQVFLSPEGPAYEQSDIRLKAANFVSTRCSGLMVVGINGGCRDAAAFRSTRPLLTYQLNGEWGRTTATGFKDGKTIAKATWRHLKGTVIHFFKFYVEWISNIRIFSICSME